MVRAATAVDADSKLPTSAMYSCQAAHCKNIHTRTPLPPSCNKLPSRLVTSLMLTMQRMCQRRPRHTRIRYQSNTKVFPVNSEGSGCISPCVPCDETKCGGGWTRKASKGSEKDGGTRAASHANMRNACIAYRRPRKAQVLMGEGGTCITPSMVAIRMPVEGAACE